MSQDWVADLYTTSTVGHTTLTNMELMFASLKSAFSGSTQPSNAVAGMPWYDTTKSLLKHRNAANSGWRGILAGTTALKLWLYLNAAQEGWVVDSSSATDMILGLKGGSTYTTGAANAGSWTVSGLSSGNESSHTHGMNSHTHSLNSHVHSMQSHTHGMNSHTHTIATSGTITLESGVTPGTVLVFGGMLGYGTTGIGGPTYNRCTDDVGAPSTANTEGPSTANTAAAAGDTGAASGSTAAGSAHNHSVSQDGTWRIRAAVGTLQYPNV